MRFIEIIRNNLAPDEAERKMTPIGELCNGCGDEIGMLEASSYIKDRNSDIGKSFHERCIPRAPAPLGRADDGPQLDAACKALMEWLSVSWDGLREDRIRAPFKPWSVNGIGTTTFQGGKQDVRDIVAQIIAAAPSPPVQSGEGQDFNEENRDA